MKYSNDLKCYNQKCKSKESCERFTDKKSDKMIFFDVETKCEFYVKKKIDKIKK